MILKLENINKKFDASDYESLADINLEIAEGEFVCVIGPSGCGKTTLLNLIAGLEAPTSGRVLLDGAPVTGAGADRVVMFQESALFPWLTVMENVKFGLRTAGVSKTAQEEKALYYLKLVKLARFRDYRPHELSGGMKQRVALARALALDSKILLMDEPFASVDKQTRNMLREEIQRICMEAGKTVFFITHSVEEAIFFADRVIMLSARPGTIIGVLDVRFPRPRHIEAPEFIELRADLLARIRKEVEKSAGQEYSND